MGMTSTEAGLSGGRVRVQLLRVPDCPLVEQVRATLQECLLQSPIPVVVEELEGPYPSPTLLIDGVDVATGKAPSRDACCRLDLPTRTQILDALQRSRP
ncbi:alkylmercury lyase [Amycolatopsis taiwanensis]|nr:alkylmercury lyase [Amycolatopsis taiwanensis]